jgi:hypothetical protein
VCVALALMHSLCVHVHGGTDIRMAHQFLLHLERRPDLVKRSPEGVPKRVPVDVLSEVPP